MNFLSIADGLADRFDPLVVTPPAGLKNITTSTAQPPNGIGNTPYVIVWPQSGDVTYTGGMVQGEHEFQVTFYYAKNEADIPREYTALEKWLGILLRQLEGATKLGLGSSGVMKALPIRWEIGTAVYGGTTYEAIILTVHVWTEEAATLTP